MLQSTRARGLQVLLGGVVSTSFLVACTAVVDGEQRPTTAGPTAGATGAGGGAAAGADPVALVATPRVVRLSRRQWENSLRELLQLPELETVTAQVTGDALVGLDNEADALRVGPQLRADLEKAASTLANLVAQEPAAMAQLLPNDAPADIAGRRESFITAFGARAFRRPLTSDEVTSYRQLFDQGPALFPADDAFIGGMKLVVAAILQSPFFLYRTELGTEVVAGRVALSDYEVASKLALALTSTLPDAELLAEAAQGKLRDKAQVVAAAERLLSTPAGAASRDHLHFQSYRLGTYDGITRDPAAFPAFTAQTPQAMRVEVLSFLAHVFEQGQGVAGIFTTPVGFVNDTLAPLYGLPQTFGATPTRVDLNPMERAGLLTLPGFLSSFAVVNDPDTIRRGVFINQRILCRVLPPPDPNATVLRPLDAGMTNRERVEATTGPGTCGQGCHSTIINPPGFAFEHFDAVGHYRSEDRGKPIDSTSSFDFFDGQKSFDGAVEFSRLLSESPEAHGCYIQGWMSYLNGHPLQAEEQAMLDHLTQESVSGKLKLKDLVVRLVSADGFLNRLP